MMKPLYIWAGGKNKMIPKYKATPKIPVSGYDTFVEPFFGGGAMMIHIYQSAPIKRFVINDINQEIIGIYEAIKTNVNDFTKRMDYLQSKYIPLDKSDRKKFYYDLREEYIQNWKKWTVIDESATLYFLMKTGFNGIWQTKKDSNGRFATPSGLLNQKKEVYDKNNVLEWNIFLQKVDIFCGDWKTCCNNIQGKSFYFMDPPYRDSFTQYAQVFGDAKHIELIDWCKKADQRGDLVFYCNRDAGDDFYIQNKGALKIQYYDVTYTAGRRSTGEDGKYQAKTAREILLHNVA